MLQQKMKAEAGHTVFMCLYLFQCGFVVISAPNISPEAVESLRKLQRGRADLSQKQEMNYAVTLCNTISCCYPSRSPSDTMREKWSTMRAEKWSSRAKCEECYRAK